MLKQTVILMKIFSSYPDIIFRLTKKRMYSAFLIIISLLLSYSSICYSQNNKFTVMIDAGHGGYDPGTRGKISQEKNITLAIALKVRNLIRDNLQDTKVILTRSTDVFVPLHERAAIANKNDANLFISVHVDGVKNHMITGTSTFVMGLHKTDENFEVAKRENSVISIEEDYTTEYENFDPNSAESYIIFNLMQNKYLEQSLSLASKIQNQFRDKIKNIDRGVKQAGFLVLWKTTMPSVLVETGFLTNPDEENYLISESGQQTVAGSIFQAFIEYKNEIQSRTITNNSNCNEKLHVSKDTSGEKKQSATQEIKPDRDSVGYNSNVNYTVKNSIPENKNTDHPDIFFKIQVGSFPKKVGTDPKKFRNLKGVEENCYNGVYKYTIGNERNYDSAIDLLKKIKKSVPDAFIIAEKNGNIITLKAALKIINPAAN